MLVDRGNDFTRDTEEKLFAYGKDAWLFREWPDRGTTRALNSYRGDIREFQYLTPRIRLTPNDLKRTALANPKMLHFICSPTRSWEILSEVEAEGWKPITIYEPIPDRCIPDELPALKKVLHLICILSPNAEEAFSLLSRPVPVSKVGIEEAAKEFLGFGVGYEGSGWVIIRSGALGAFVTSRDIEGAWVDAFWTAADVDKVVDVTGAGNSFLGGLAAGLEFTGGNVLEATFYASVSSSFVIEQGGLPTITNSEMWNGDQPRRRLAELRSRFNRSIGDDRFAFQSVLRSRNT